MLLNYVTATRAFGFIALLSATSVNAESLFLQNSTRSGDLQINQAAVELLRSDSKSLELDGVPLITGTTSDFTLVPMPIFESDTAFVLQLDNGTTEAIAAPDVRTWYGVDPDNPARAMFISAGADGRVRSMVTGDDETSVTVISPAGASLSSYYIEPADLPAIPYCDSEEVMGTMDVPAQRDTRTDVLYELEMMVDVGHNLYKHLDRDNTKVTDYLVDLFGAVNVIYQRDVKLRLTLKHVVVWGTPDPIHVNNPSEPEPGINTSDQLSNYGEYIRLNRNSVVRDLAHFLDRNPGLGGRAYIRVLDSGQALYRLGVSNVNATGFPDSPSTYYWDTKVVAHEIGHNVGSQHTHCYTPAIDCCYVEDGCSGCTSASPTAGTIMSYCHLLAGSGGSIKMEFHDRTKSLMRFFVEGSQILSPYPNQPNIQVDGVDGIYIAPYTSLSGPASRIVASDLGGPAVTETFTIKNDGTQDLLLLGHVPVQLSGSEYLEVVTQPTRSIPPGTSVEFQVKFDPQESQKHIGNVRILTNDPDTPSYKFVIEGQIVAPSEPYTFTFTGSTLLPDPGQDWLVIPVNVTGVPGIIRDVDFRFNGSDCSIPSSTGMEHPWVGDLEIMMRSPSNTFVTLVNHPGPEPSGANGANFCNTVLDDDTDGPALHTITAAQAPYTGSWKPFEPLSAYDGESPNGQWSVFFFDWRATSQGRIRSFSIVIRGEVVRADADNWTLYE